MRHYSAALLLALALCGCGGGGSVSNAVSNPAVTSGTYTGSFFDANNDNLGTATVVINGSSVRFTLVPSSSLKSTIQTGGTIVNGQILAPPDPTQAIVGEIAESGTTVTISGYQDGFNGYGTLSVVATS